MNLLEVARLSHSFHLITGGVEDFSLAQGCGQGNLLRTSKVVVLHVLFQEGGGLSPDHIKVSEVLPRLSESFWEAELCLNLIGEEWEALGSVVLNPTRRGNMKMVVDGMSTAWDQSR